MRAARRLLVDLALQAPEFDDEGDELCDGEQEAKPVQDGRRDEQPHSRVHVDRGRRRERLAEHGGDLVARPLGHEHGARDAAAEGDRDAHRVGKEESRVLDREPGDAAHHNGTEDEHEAAAEGSHDDDGGHLPQVLVARRGAGGGRAREAGVLAAEQRAGALALVPGEEDLPRRRDVVDAARAHVEPRQPRLVARVSKGDELQQAPNGRKGGRGARPVVAWERVTEGQPHHAQ
mmetsp:Transcript_9364/g.29000  ORF Transcript_9364/g.29000 Transcript_9364/m.29000 type:complete len:233 (+) Transcript_9364:282-980(+)